MDSSTTGSPHQTLVSEKVMIVKLGRVMLVNLSVACWKDNSETLNRLWIQIEKKLSLWFLTARQKKVSVHWLTVFAALAW